MSDFLGKIEQFMQLPKIIEHPDLLEDLNIEWDDHLNDYIEADGSEDHPIVID